MAAISPFRLIPSGSEFFQEIYKRGADFASSSGFEARLEPLMALLPLLALHLALLVLLALLALLASLALPTTPARQRAGELQLNGS